MLNAWSAAISFSIAHYGLLREKKEIHAPVICAVTAMLPGSTLRCAAAILEFQPRVAEPRFPAHPQ